MERHNRKEDDPITPILCEAYREAIRKEINGIKSTIKTVGIVLGLLFTIFELVILVVLQNSAV